MVVSDQQLTELLEEIAANQNLHARFLNTLSFMEYIGARKIFKSQQSDWMDLQLLKHASEEARHALFFKQLSAQLCDGQLDSYQDKHLLAGRMAEDYFQNLDRQAQAMLAHDYVEPQLTWLSYHYVTWLIEMRATHVYQLYQKILLKVKPSFSLRFLLNEETQHLTEILDGIRGLDPAFELRSVQMMKFEEDLFSDLYLELLRSVRNQETLQDSVSEQNQYV